LLGRKGTVPWSVGEKAYEGYAKRFPGTASHQDIEKIAYRGGFSEDEMDEFYPAWRAESEGR